MNYNELVKWAKNPSTTPYEIGLFFKKQASEKEFLEFVGELIQRVYGWPS